MADKGPEIIPSGSGAAAKKWYVFSNFLKVKFTTLS